MSDAGEPSDRASSPVVGIILIVAITIIIGAVLAGFMLDMGESVEESGPTASFEYSYSDKNNQVKVELKRGDTLDGNLLRFGGAATEKTTFGGITEWTGRTVEAGDTATVEVKSDETLRVIWQANSSDQTAILSTYEVPNDPSATASIGTVDTTAAAKDHICLFDVQFNNAWGGSVYVVAQNLDRAGVSYSALVATSGEDVKLGVNGNDVGAGDTWEITVYETKNENIQLYSEESTAGNANKVPSC
jgi:FlaG/FlaF family flagellin (archaellin)